MKEHLRSAFMELETENSQRSNGEGEDVEMENTNNAPIEIDTLLDYRQNNGYIGNVKDPSYVERGKRFNLPYKASRYNLNNVTIVRA